MPRRRMIDPDIWHDPWFGHLEPLEQVFWVGLISNADDSGRILAEPAYLRSHIFAYKDIPIETIESIINKFQNTNSNFIIYNNNGTNCIYLKRWQDYQTIAHPTPSKLPPPNNNLLTNLEQFTNDSRNNLEQFTNDSSQLINKDIINKDIINIYTVWNERKIIVHKKMTDDIERAISTALKNNTVDEIIVSINNYVEILNDEQYYFKYSWTLKDFLKRGLQKFLDIDICKKNYSRDNRDNTYQKNKNQTKSGKWEHMVRR